MARMYSSDGGRKTMQLQFRRVKYTSTVRNSGWKGRHKIIRISRR